MWFKRKTSDLPFVQDYLESNSKPSSNTSDLSELKLIVVDIETSGLDIHKDRILSVSTLCIDRMELSVDSLRQWLVYQPDPFWNQAVEIHGILPSETQLGKPEDDVMRELLPILANHPVVGHHVGFDLRMLDRAARRHFGLKLCNRWVDTAHLSMHVLDAFHHTGYPGQRPPSLDDICSQLNITVIDRHTSTGDAYACAEAFLLLSARLRKHLGRPLRLKDISM
jgi:DNA polymerase III subunit epsilon